MSVKDSLFVLLAAAGALGLASCGDAPPDVSRVSGLQKKVGEECVYFTPCCVMTISRYTDMYGRGALPGGPTCPNVYDPNVHCQTINNDTWPPLFCGLNSGSTPVPCNGDCICSNAPAASGGCAVFDENSQYFDWLHVGYAHVAWPECGTGQTLVHLNGQVYCVNSSCLEGGGGGNPPPPGGYPCVPYKTCADYPPTCGYVSDGCNPEGLFCNTRQPCNDQ
jgi:hypothetical protein